MTAGQTLPLLRANIVQRAIDVQSLVDELTHPEHGATALFLGTVRSINEGRTVTGIEYYAYEAMAEREMSTVLTEAIAENEGVAILVEHRVGMLTVGEISIAVVAAHEHRQRAINAMHYAVEQIKKRAPIWKREHYADGVEEWVDPAVGGQS